MPVVRDLWVWHDIAIADQVASISLAADIDAGRRFQVIWVASIVVAAHTAHFPDELLRKFDHNVPDAIELDHHSTYYLHADERSVVDDVETFPVIERQLNLHAVNLWAHVLKLEAIKYNLRNMAHIAATGNLF